MRLNFLSNKGSVAPLIYLILQIIIVGGMAITCPDIIKFDGSSFIILFWVNLVITVALFFYVHFLDPGYVPHDGVFFTEQEEPPVSVSYSQSHSHQLKYDSMMKLRQGESKIMSPDFGFSPVGSDLRFKGTTIGAMLKNYNQTASERAERDEAINGAPSSAGLAESNGMLRNSTHMMLSVVSPIPKPIKEETIENPQSYDERYKNIENNIDDPIEDRVDVSLSQEDELPPDGDAPDGDVAPGNENGKDSTKQPGTEGEEEEDQDEVLDMNDLRMNTQEYIQSQLNMASPSNIQLAVITTNKPAFQPNYMGGLDDIVEEMTGQATELNTGVQETFGKSASPIKRRQETFGQVKMTLQPEQNQLALSPQGIDDSANRDKKQDSDKKKSKASNSRTGGLDDPSTKETRSSTGLNNVFSGRSAIEAPHGEYVSNNSIKLTIGDYNNMKSLVSEPALPRSGYDHSISNNGNKKSEHEVPVDNELYIERRYCTVCSLEQPLRAKHCKECKRCVGRYDHHCPWIGSCVGELNHLSFCFFLIFQFIEVLWGEIILGADVFENSLKARWMTEDIWRVILLITTTFFLGLVGSLMMFHCYIATQNLTTWEYLSWNKISYLKEWPAHWGSPFTMGMMQNLKFFLSKKKSISRWKMPKYRAPLSQQEAMVNQEK